MPPTHQKRGPWSRSEDDELLRLVKFYGPQHWVKISECLKSRTPKQCRERFHQNLKPTLNHSPISAEEGAQIESLVRQIGKRWAEISRRLPGRSDNAVKNWWNGGVNRRRRLADRREAPRERWPTSHERGPQLTQIHSAAGLQQRPLPPYPFQAPPLPLVSPAYSEASVPDSIGEAPSLMSDNDSHQTLPSPNTHPGLPFIGSHEVPAPTDCHKIAGSPGCRINDGRHSTWRIAHAQRNSSYASNQNQEAAVTDGRLQQLSELASSRLSSCPPQHAVDQPILQELPSSPLHSASVNGASRRIGQIQDLPLQASNRRLPPSIADLSPCQGGTSSLTELAMSDGSRAHAHQSWQGRPAQTTMSVDPRLSTASNVPHASEKPASSESAEPTRNMMTLSSIMH